MLDRQKIRRQMRQQTEGRDESIEYCRAAVHQSYQSQHVNTDPFTRSKGCHNLTHSPRNSDHNVIESSSMPSRRSGRTTRYPTGDLVMSRFDVRVATLDILHRPVSMPLLNGRDDESCELYAHAQCMEYASKNS